MTSREVIKRAIDCILASIGLVILSPVIGLVALIILATAGRPVFYRQVRPGRNQEPFVIIKFRTMRAPVAGESAVQSDHARLTRLGRWLRKTSLDELPELWSVLKGDMSLVGPRPLLMEYLPYFTPRERRRFFMRPGVTGRAQVNGRNHTSWAQRFEDDVFYVEHWSLRMDFQILIRTLSALVTCRDVAVDARSIMRNLNEERQASLPVDGVEVGG